ncbi:MAG TPA: hypothetical protein H9902_15195 [Candidatus Stackebrandtia faecavium]|nr:hypothetical protein [Candidatus Stackebrandtia faecavium]
MISDNSHDPKTNTPVRSRWRAFALVGGAVILIAALVGVYLVVFNDAEDPPSDKPASRPSQCVPVNQGATVDAPQEPPEDGGIEVVERNAMVSQRPNSPYAMSTFGAVLKNESSLVAYGIEVAFTPLNEKGKRFTDYDYREPVEPIVKQIPYILPGQEFGLGSRIPILTEKDNPQADVKVEADVREWWEPKNTKHEFAEVTATTTDDGKDVGDTRIEFTLNSGFCDTKTEMVASTLYRDSDGNIMGGQMGTDVKVLNKKDKITYPKVEPGSNPDSEVPNVWHQINENHLDGAAPEPDLTQSSIYPYIDESTEE